jgi:L-iditol 2-dehydrogenase
LRAARLHAPGDVRLHDAEADPVPGAGEELVRVDAVGLCGSDLHWFSEGAIGDAVLGTPLVLGHEIAGTIASGPRRGLRVAVDPSVPCWACAPCLDGNPNLCLDVVFAGHGVTDGGLRQLMAWPSSRLHAMPDDFDPDTIALLEPLGVAIHAVDLAHLRLGDRVLVVGCGPIGQLVVRLARAAGASAVLAVEPLEHRRALAAQHGADTAGPEEAQDLVERHTGRHGADVAIEIAGTDDGVDVALRGVRPGGRVVLAGIPDGGRTSFVASTARRKGLTLVMSRRMKEVYPRAVRLVSSGTVPVADLVSDVFPLEQAEAAFASAAGRGGHKVVVHPWQDRPGA